MRNKSILVLTLTGLALVFAFRRDLTTRSADIGSPGSYDSFSRVGGHHDRSRTVPPPLPPEAVQDAVLLPTSEQVWRQKLNEPAFEQFREWSFRFESSSWTDRVTLEAEGVRLATVRQAALKQLIKTDPKQALGRTVPTSVRRLLPSSVLELLEKRVDGRGDLSVLASLSLPEMGPKAPALWRTVTLGDRLYVAHVYGRRLDEPSRQGIPIHGIVVENQMAVDENPVRILDPGESEAALVGDPVCGVAGWTASTYGTTTAVDDGESTAMVLCSPAHAEEVNRKLIQMESNSGSTQTAADGTVRPASAYTEGTKRLLLIRVDFSDKVGEPFPNTRATNLVRAIDQFYRENSYGRAGFRNLGEGSAVTATLRLPRANADYSALDPSKLREEARSVAAAAGYVLNNYDFDVICFKSVAGYGWSGLGYVGAPGAWVQDAFDEAGGVFCHELGHNFGLNHANFWDTGGESVIGSKGNDVEYGDSFDTMGNATAGRRHFNARNKAYLNWIRGTSELQTLSTSGTFRLFAHDMTNNSGLRALKVIKDAKTNYWFEYRARFADNRWMSNGIGIRRARSDSARQSQLLDTTAGSSDGKNDSPLVVGRTFSDPVAGIHVTPIQLNSTVPPSVDVVFNRGKFPENHGPKIELMANASSVGLNSPVNLTAMAVDEDGDSLAYAWDFGDGSMGENTSSITHRWSVVGDYVVRCVVSDMKGGTASGYVVVKVGNPTTFRITGQIRRDSVPLEGIRVFVSNTRLTYTASDGTYVLTGLSKGQYTIKALSEGLLFTREGFSNPLNLSADAVGINFEGALPGDLEVSALVPAGAEWEYNDLGRDLGTGWRGAAYDSASWKKGPAQLGYGDDDVVTVIGYGPNASSKYITSYFRHAFFVAEPDRILSASLGLMRDDGALVYLNGREVFRSNMPTGTINYRTLASSTVSGTDESTYYEVELAGTDFAKGKNILAVELHQGAVESSDLSFNLRLDALMTPSTTGGVSPELAAETTSEGIKVSWPAVFTGYALQVRSTLSGGEDWQPVEVPVITVGDQVRAMLLLKEEAVFLRLSR